MSLGHVPGSGGRQAFDPSVGAATTFKPGQSGNPTGISRYAKAVRDAINRQETPERVCEVIDAMRTQALAGEKSSPAAAKVYLEAVGVKAEPVKVDLSQAPDEVVAWLAENVA